MKIILKQEVPFLGHSGDVVEVKQGYARNYLLPKKLAVPATPGYMKDLAKRIEAAKAREVSERDEARALGDRIRDAHLTIVHRASEGGTRLHGSVTSPDIAEALKQSMGIELDRRMIDLRNPIRHLGTHQVTIKLVRGVSASLRISVVDPSQPAPVEEPAAVEAQPETAAGPETDETEAPAEDDTTSTEDATAPA